MRNQLVLQAFRQPDAVTAFTVSDWDLLIRQARAANLLASLDAVLHERGLIEHVPPQAREHLAWSRAVALRQHEAVQWEVRLVRKALAETGIPVILLKGAAYLMAKLPHAAGRLFSDIDILVPKTGLAAVEAALMLNGWATTHHDEYDQRYYRRWMHELPPMRHIKRMTVIDVHHAILPETSPLRPDPDKLRAAACRLDGCDDLMTLAPVDLVLHSAVHLLHDGELEHGLRDLVDIDRMLRHFGGVPGFWPALVERAGELGLTRPLFYALRYATGLLETPVPAAAIEAADIGRPRRMMLMLMDQLFGRALLPDHPSCCDWFTKPARQMLYVRANWLRMPPLLLARHLFHKAFLSPRQE